MPEIKKEPYIFWMEELDDKFQCEGFGPYHSLADIARWICWNKYDAEEMLRLIKEELER